MIPHTPKPPLERERPGCSTRSFVGPGSAELSSHESGDPTTGVLCLSLRLRLRENTDHRLRSGGPHEHAPTAVEPLVQAVCLLEHRLGELLVRHAEVLLCLREPLHH